VRLQRAELAKGTPCRRRRSGAAVDRAGFGQGAAAVPQRDHAVPVPLGLPQGRQAARRVQDWAQREVRPILHRLVERSIAEDILQPKAAYGFWPAASDGHDVVLFGLPGSPDEGREVWRFDLPRQAKAAACASADFLRDVRTTSATVIVCRW